MYKRQEYDYVARMGGDEFVVVAPGLAADAAASRAHQLKELAKQAGREVCSCLLYTSMQQVPTQDAAS